MRHGWQLLRRKVFATLENQRLMETELASSATFRSKRGGAEKSRRKKGARGRLDASVEKSYFFATTRIISKHCLA